MISELALIESCLSSFTVPSVNQVHNDYPGPWAVLVSTLISARTRDTITLDSSRRLLTQAPGPKQLVELELKHLEKLIYPVNFYKTKARNLKNISVILLNKYNCKVPASLELLTSLPGTGRKTANLVLGKGFGIPAICVDTHVHRISNRTGWIKTSTPEASEKALQKILPRNRWISLNKLLVTFGQNICTPSSPHCSKCPIMSGCKRIGVNKKR